MHVEKFPLPSEHSVVFGEGMHDKANAKEFNISIIHMAKSNRFCTRDNFARPPFKMINSIVEEPAMDSVPEMALSQANAMLVSWLSVKSQRENSKSKREQRLELHEKKSSKYRVLLNENASQTN